MNTEKLIILLDKIADRIDAEKDYLCELDSPIGDGDHGTNMARGFNEVKKKLPSLVSQSPAEVLKTVGITLVSSVGGAAGPLYGTAFMKAGDSVKGKSELDISDFTNSLSAAIEGVIARGKAHRGEKTMLDSMIPSLSALNMSIANGDDTMTSLDEALSAAEDGVYYTKTIAASKGRASYLGVRSIGHQDPGATSYKIILEVIVNFYKENAPW
ncbi:dihydroxyacetone kinase subunit DhaL [Lachnospiraceae bacterium C1.1]|nr:dihydroxyacetone kinase subunit DhaL [Lachnospiraceae bacterium C1.1]